MKPLDYILTAIIILCLAAAVSFIIKRTKSGRCCGGNCCNRCGGCNDYSRCNGKCPSDGANNRDTSKTETNKDDSDINAG